MPPRAGTMRDIENGSAPQVQELKHQEHDCLADKVKIGVLEYRIERLEAALQALLKEKEQEAETTDEEKNEEKQSAPELTDEEKCLPENWAQRFQWRRKNQAREGEEYLEIESRSQDADPTSKSWISLIHDEDIRGAPTRILIRNPKIQAHLRARSGLETFEEVKLNLNSIEISSPFSPLFHHIDAVIEAVDKDEGATAMDKADIYALNMFCTQGPVGSMFQDIRKLIQQDLIRAEEQWALFRPGMYVVTKLLGEYEVLKVKSIRLEEIRSFSFFKDRTPDDRYLVCTQIAWNGKIFGQREREVRLQKFPGSRKIVELNVSPLEVFPEAERMTIIEGCIERGKKWALLCKSPQAIPRDVDTRCLPLVSESRGYWDPFTGKEKRNDPVEIRITGRVIVDPAASVKASKLGIMTETFALNLSEIEPFTELSVQTMSMDEQYMVCAALIEVFSLVDHIWYRVPVLELKMPEWAEDPWEQLELTSQRKELLKTLVLAHTNQLNKSEDVIKKKGKGLVFLFHGQPGLGKTLTAEALSESIKRPLYRVNIGLLAAKVDWEPDLEKIFRDAHSWQAVLLLDEAEVIMEARTKDRMEQNSWCSVFLRKLEYYEGILILTTNMIHSIDKAFRSRINIAIHYDELTLEQKTNLWTLFLSHLTPETARTKELMQNVPRWAKLELNGRSIRNIVLTAESLALGKAQSEYTKMDASHVQTVIDDTMAFNDAIQNEKKKRTLKVGSVPGNWL